MNLTRKRKLFALLSTLGVVITFIAALMASGPHTVLFSGYATRSSVLIKELILNYIKVTF